jgi:trk system potassium uptake protein TrkH
MFLGSMAGSTGGGIKTLRLLLLVKHAYLEIVRVIHPHAMTIVKLGKIPVSQAVLRSVWGFFILFMGIFVLATLVMSALGVDFMTAVSSVASSLGTSDRAWALSGRWITSAACRRRESGSSSPACSWGDWRFTR